MNKKDWIKLGLCGVVAVLLILVILSVISLEKTKENIDIKFKNPIKEESVFLNESDMEEKEIRILIEEKRTKLKEIFKKANYYKISEVSNDHTKEDDEKYIVVEESFLNELKELLTIELYTNYWNEFTEVTPKKDISIKNRIYRTRKDLFDEVYTKSAIALLEVNEELLTLKMATNEKIESLENIKFCEENQEPCKRNEFYSFVLIKEENEWKISEFTKKN